MKVKTDRSRIKYEDIWYKWDERWKIEEKWNKIKDRLERTRENERRKQMREVLQ